MTKSWSGVAGTMRAGLILVTFMALTLPLMPVQAMLIKTSPRLARKLPHWYHKQVCRLIGLRISVDGMIAGDRPVLLVSNHSSWLDIPVLSSLAPLSFVAKREVAAWPFVSSLARLQRTVFVDRERRCSVGETADELSARLGQGDAIVLFAEGTSSDGNLVLPFRSSLFAAAAVPKGASRGAAEQPVAQTASVVYTRLHGVPMGRSDRVLTGWFGDMAFGGHAWNLLKAGPLDAVIKIGAPIAISAFADRKDLAYHAEREVRSNLVRTLRALPADASIETTRPAAVARRKASGQKWT